MRYLLLLLLLLAPSPAPSSSHFPNPHSGQGFARLFTDNPTTFHEYPVVFEHPTPDWVQGSVIRNGLGQFGMGNRNVSHSFDAFGKLTKVSLNGSNIGLFSHKFIESHYYKDSVQTKTVAPYMLFQSPKPAFSWRERIQAMYHGCDNTNVNILRLEVAKSSSSEVDSSLSLSASSSSNNASSSSSSSPFSYFATSDFWPIYSIDGATLETGNKIMASLPKGVDWTTHLPLPATSHPLKEYNSNHYISFVNVLNPLPWSSNSINVIRMTSLHDRELIASIPVPHIPYMHAFGLSEHYAVIFANPAFVNVKNVILTGDAASSMDWMPEKGTDVFAVELQTGKVQKFHTEKGEVNMHFVNAWEEGNKIFVDYVNYRNLNLVKAMEVETLRNGTLRDQTNGSPRLVRYILNLETGTVRQKLAGGRAARGVRKERRGKGQQRGLHAGGNEEQVSVGGRLQDGKRGARENGQRDSVTVQKRAIELTAQREERLQDGRGRGSRPESVAVEKRARELRGWRGKQNRTRTAKRKLLKGGSGWRRTMERETRRAEKNNDNIVKMKRVENIQEIDPITRIKKQKKQQQKETDDIKMQRKLRQSTNGSKKQDPYPTNHFDFPVINPKYQFRKYCYVYGIAIRSDREHLAHTSLIKKDLCSSGRQGGNSKSRVVHIPNHYFSEPQFIARPNAVEEDDGVLLSLAMDGTKEQSYIAMFDARTMVQMNKALLPTTVPFTLHGHFFPGQV